MKAYATSAAEIKRTLKANGIDFPVRSERMESAFGPGALYNVWPGKVTIHDDIMQLSGSGATADVFKAYDERDEPVAEMLRKLDKAVREQWRNVSVSARPIPVVKEG